VYHSALQNFQGGHPGEDNEIEDCDGMDTSGADISSPVTAGVVLGSPQLWLLLPSFMLAFQ
jgi:hypothetical protein